MGSKETNVNQTAKRCVSDVNFISSSLHELQTGFLAYSPVFDQKIKQDETKTVLG